MLEIQEKINIGDRFGNLVVTSDYFIVGYTKYRKVLCDCGQENEVSERNLLSTVSCGCAVGEKYKPLQDLPEEHKKMKHKFLRNGKLLIVEDQTVYRVKGKLLYKCAVSKTSRGYRYDQVSYQENGKQKHVTIHRLMAEAFIPNPENKPQVNHIDGNPGNNSLENLEWATARENIQHAYETGLIRTLENTPHKCIKCRGAAMNDGELCSNCKRGLKDLKRRLKNKQRQRERYSHINLHDLKDQYRKIIIARSRGSSLQEIGDRLGVTREYIRQLEKRVMDKDPIVYTQQVQVEKARKTVSYPITINEARKTSGSTQEEFARELGVTASTLSKYENYKSIMTVDKAMKFSELVGIPFEKIDFIGSDVK